MKKLLHLLLIVLLPLAFVVVGTTANAGAPDSTSATRENGVKFDLPLTKKVGNKTLACTYNSPTLHGGSTGHVVWNGSQGELVTVTNYLQKITSPDCDDSVRSATNWLCFKNGNAANCGAELTHWVEDVAGNQWAITVYDCQPGNSCFGSSGADGIHTTYSAWKPIGSMTAARSHLDVQQVTVVGRTSISNHHSTSLWVTL